jgi:GPH family glycoside/pentoside/hexuronide:cation symporter
MIFSAASVGAKLGGGSASAIIGKILDSTGYDGLAAMQSTTATGAILNMYVWGPVIIWLIAVALLIFYRLDKQYPSIMEELHAREMRGEL